jgi:hypothetical protein
VNSAQKPPAPVWLEIALVVGPVTLTAFVFGVHWAFGVAGGLALWALCCRANS